MNRRDFMIGGAIVGTASAWPVFGSAIALGGPLPLQQAATEAWLYGLMLIENSRARSLALKQARPNELIHERVLKSPKSQSVVSPNNDTLYSRAWIDLSAGPVKLVMPAVGTRYISYQFMDMYGNSFAVLGSRTTGGAAREVTIVGPADATVDPLALRSPTRWAWLLIRVLIDGESDRSAANAIQDRIAVIGPARDAPPAFASRADAWPAYFESVQALLAENPPPVTDLAFFDRVGALGLGPRRGFDAKKFSASQIKQIEAGVAQAREQARAPRSGRVANGWVYPDPSLGDFGQNYRYRAQIALSGLAALPPAEAMYMRPVAADGTHHLDAAQDWVLRFDAGKFPPVDAFWSLTMYRITPEGQYFFFDNPIDRYAIGDRTPGLRHGDDGSLDIWISRRDPGKERRANWLPAPDGDNFAVSFRAYLPKRELLDGSWLLPALRVV